MQLRSYKRILKLLLNRTKSEYSNDGRDVLHASGCRHPRRRVKHGYVQTKRNVRVGGLRKGAGAEVFP